MLGDEVGEGLGVGNGRVPDGCSTLPLKDLSITLLGGASTPHPRNRLLLAVDVINAVLLGEEGTAGLEIDALAAVAVIVTAAALESTGERGGGRDDPDVSGLGGARKGAQKSSSDDENGGSSGRHDWSK